MLASYSQKQSKATSSFFFLSTAQHRSLLLSSITDLEYTNSNASLLLCKSKLQKNHTQHQTNPHPHHYPHPHHRPHNSIPKTQKLESQTYRTEARADLTLIMAGMVRRQVQGDADGGGGAALPCRREGKGRGTRGGEGELVYRVRISFTKSESYLLRFWLWAAAGEGSQGGIGDPPGTRGGVSVPSLLNNQFRLITFLPGSLQYARDIPSRSWFLTEALSKKTPTDLEGHGGPLQYDKNPVG